MTIKPASELSFEEALEELEEITSDLTSGSLTLEESVKAYKRGAELSDRCASLLNKANEEIKKVKQPVSLKSFEEDESGF